MIPCMLCSKTHVYPYDKLKGVWWLYTNPSDRIAYACSGECYTILQAQRGLQNPRGRVRK